MYNPTNFERSKSNQPTKRTCKNCLHTFVTLDTGKVFCDAECQEEYEEYGAPERFMFDSPEMYHCQLD